MRNNWRRKESETFRGDRDCKNIVDMESNKIHWSLKLRQNNTNSTCTAITVTYDLWHSWQWHQGGLRWWTIENSKTYRWQLEVRSHCKFQHVIARNPARRYWRISINTTLETVGIAMAMRLPGNSGHKNTPVVQCNMPTLSKLGGKVENKWTLKIREMQDAISFFMLS